MLKNTKSMPLFIAFLGCCILVNGCESKVNQCAKFTEVTKKMRSTTTNAKSAKKEDLLKVSSTLDSLNQELENVKVGDGKLNEFKTRYAKVYGDISQSLKNTVTGLQKPDAKVLNKALRDLEDASSQQASLAKELETYCSSN